MSRMRRLLASTAAGLLVALVAAPGSAAAAPGPSDAPEYWFDTWHVQSLWDSGARGGGITIAEIDTGVNAGLPELSGSILSGTDLGLGGNGQIDREVDEFGHGTAMASIMVARPGLLDITGLAPDAKILPIAVPLNGTTDAGQPDQLPTAIRYAADHGAKIISMSLGGKRVPGTDSLACDPDEQQAIYYALRKGVLLVAAVGNTGTTPNTVEDPGVCLGVLAVGAVDSSGTVASFSGRQPYLSLVAPGVNIPSLSRVPGQAYAGDGTSQATAITSAVAALVWSSHPTLTARQVATRILATLDDRRSTPSTSYGYGELNAYNAVTATVSPSAPDPVFDAVAPFLARSGDLAAPAPAAPKPVAYSRGQLGVFHVGSVSAPVDPKLILGVVLAVLGVAGIAALVVLRRRAAAAAAVPLPSAAGPTLDGWPALAPERGPVPAPEPGPVPEPGLGPGPGFGPWSAEDWRPPPAPEAWAPPTETDETNPGGRPRPRPSPQPRPPELPSD